jgi:hypothetical protein
VKFSVQTAPKLDDGGVGAFGAFNQVAQAPNPPGSYPASCPLSGSSPCPVDLATALGPTDSKNEFLNLQITVDPTPDGLAGPTVNSWQITYDCVPNE